MAGMSQRPRTKREIYVRELEGPILLIESGKFMKDVSFLIKYPAGQKSTCLANL